MSDTPSHNQNLRPVTIEEYIGQDSAVKTLKIFLNGVKKRGVASEHILFYGPPGIGKTTLSYIIARELEGDLKVTTGATLTKTGDLAAILTNLKDNDVLFVDEIHRMPKAVEEMLYPVMEEYALDIIIGKGPSARTMRLPIPRITIVGATTKLAMLSAPLRDRFGLVLRLDFYNESQMTHIIKRSASLIGIQVTDDAASHIARRSRRTPRIANRILKRAHDVAQAQGVTLIDVPLLEKLFGLLEIDSVGLTDIDVQYLRAIATMFENQPVGVETLSSSLAEDKRTIEEFIEPYLLQIGFIRKTSRGRIVTSAGLAHLSIRSTVTSDEQDRLM
jgi:Holliday junction DNA helicase RuvB